jgi:hypothetical protein
MVNECLGGYALTESRPTKPVRLLNRGAFSNPLQGYGACASGNKQMPLSSQSHQHRPKPVRERNAGSLSQLCYRG